MPISTAGLEFQPPQIEPPVNAMLRMAQLQSAAQQAQYNALQQRQLQSQLTEAENLRTALPLLDLSTEEGTRSLLNISPNFGAKMLTERRAAEASAAEARKKAFELANARIAAFREGLREVRSPQQMADWYRAQFTDPELKNHPVIQQHPLEVKLGNIPQTPKEFEQYRNMVELGMDRFLSQTKPTIVAQDLGGATRQLAITSDGTTATVIPGSTATKSLTPGEAKKKQDVIDVGYAVITQETDPVTGRTRILSTIPKGLTPEQARTAAGERNVVAHSFIDDAGNVTSLNKFGQRITPTTETGEPLAIKDKPSATFAKATEMRKNAISDLTSTIGELKEIVKPGGLLDTATGSGFGSMLDAAGNFVGIATAGSIATAKLKPIADMVLKMVPRFEGPQSDKDTQSYKDAAADLANSTLPIKTRKAAAEIIVRLMEKRKSQFITREMEAMGIGGVPGTGVDTNNPLVRQIGGAK